MTENVTKPGLHHGTVSRQRIAEKAMMAAIAAPAMAPAKKAAKKAGAAAKKASAINIGGSKGTGFFDRMFDLPALVVSNAKLDKLADAMLDANPGSPALNNAKIPAGFTYLGQFVDHDITLDLTPLGEAVADPIMVKNFRSPALDLDCVYGAGPGPFRFLFAREDDGGGGFRDTPFLLLGPTAKSDDQNGVPIPAAGKDNDLPRNRHGAAIIGDHRNDENLLVAQTHVAFLKFHNKVVARLKTQGTPEGQLFDKASELVRWHYQWMVLHDFVERLTEPGMVAKILQEGRKFYRFKERPYMPVEFAVAAYRLGHSMVREVYSHNRVFPADGSGLATGSLDFLFLFSGLSGGLAGELGGTSPTLPTNWIIDWRRFYQFNTPGIPLNLTRKLDPFLAPALHTLPGGGGNLAARNLKRGVMMGLPSGQAVAAEMKKKISFTAITKAELESGTDGVVLKQQGLSDETPLWYYILKEAQVKGGGERLGPVGARIVAEVFVGLVHGSPGSYLGQPNWKPTLPAKVTGTFTMVDLLNFVGEVSPIDGVTSLP